MTAYKKGQYQDYFWIEFSGNRFTLCDLLNRCSNVLLDKYLAIICFDSGPLRLINEEEDLGWYEKNNVAFSPKLTDNIIAALPTEQHDQWCLFKTPTEISGMTYFVNYRGFTLSSRQQELVDVDPTWDKVGIEKQIEYHEQLVEQFWDEVLTMNPTSIIADGNNFIFVSKDIDEIEVLKKYCR
ncbi:hypothetical protein [Paraflavitalea sp. CAU 1676]|uniref:hypothetical protein n=1 Tax=Paraflavitalea sp. CAU 1676 TaxID=3032598 RepID=UPI0023D9E36D|nr:hypothetical protein [Paraflavitalea sp. CAU 1676]MDF2189341.1 hypothetical protein [Paraflavitalea sp. CAU 1676]